MYTYFKISSKTNPIRGGSTYLFWFYIQIRANLSLESLCSMYPFENVLLASPEESFRCSSIDGDGLERFAKTVSNKVTFNDARHFIGMP